ncbi:MAG: oligosaccharide flippase family protein, partial [Solirubrobacteraceae bacterium]
LRISPRNASRAELRRLATFGGGLLATRVIGTLYRQMDKLIIGSVLGTRLVTPYEVANKVQSGPAMVRSIAASSLLPATAYIREKREVLRDMYLRGSSYTVALTLPVVAGTFIFTGPLIAGWVGDALKDDASTTTRLFLCYLAVGLPQAVGQSMLVALGRIRPVLVIASSALAINVAVSLALVSPLGIEGVVIGTLVSGIVTWPSLLRLCLREFGVSVRGWLEAIGLPNLPGLTVQAATALPLLHLAERADSLAVTGILVLLSVLLSFAAYLSVGLGRPQRQVLLRTLKEATGIRIGADVAPEPESSTP